MCETILSWSLTVQSYLTLQRKTETIAQGLKWWREANRKHGGNSSPLKPDVCWVSWDTAQQQPASQNAKLLFKRTQTFFFSFSILSSFPYRDIRAALSTDVPLQLMIDLRTGCSSAPSVCQQWLCPGAFLCLCVSARSLFSGLPRGPGLVSHDVLKNTSWLALLAAQAALRVESSRACQKFHHTCGSPPHLLRSTYN